jgi:hypothetical protein
MKVRLKLCPFFSLLPRVNPCVHLRFAFARTPRLYSNPQLCFPLPPPRFFRETLRGGRRRCPSRCLSTRASAVPSPHPRSARRRPARWGAARIGNSGAYSPPPSSPPWLHLRLWPPPPAAVDAILHSGRQPPSMVEDHPTARRLRGRRHQDPTAIPTQEKIASFWDQPCFLQGLHHSSGSEPLLPDSIWWGILLVFDSSDLMMIHIARACVYRQLHLINQLLTYTNLWCMLYARLNYHYTYVVWNACVCMFFCWPFSSTRC